MLSPTFLWPATSNAYSGHPAIPVTAITNSSTPKITLQPTCDGSCIAVISPARAIRNSRRRGTPYRSPAVLMSYSRPARETGPRSTISIYWQRMSMPKTSRFHSTRPVMERITEAARHILTAPMVLATACSRLCSIARVSVPTAHLVPPIREGGVLIIPNLLHLCN